MRWYALIGGVGVLVMGLVGGARADGWRTTTSYSPYTASNVSPAPGCATPAYPPSSMPSLAPGTGMPSMGTPGTGTPGTGTPGMGTTGTGTTGTGTNGMGTTGADGQANMGDSGSALGEAGSGSLGSAAPNMIGDLGNRGTALVSSSPSRTTRVPLAGQGSFKISENESPRPQDRFFCTYNYFNSVQTFGNGNFDLHREVIGFEKTFLDGNASFGMRLPFVETERSGGGSLDGVGDLSLIFKYAVLNNRETGNVLSGGLVVTVPTGRDIIVADGSDIHSTLLQPWVGGIYNCGDFYILGFSSAVIPTETKDATFISNDLGIAYRLWKSCDQEQRGITSLTPTIEGHLVDPLNHDGNSGGLVAFDNQFIMTAGVHIGLCNIGTLTLAGASPVTGPRAFAAEFIAQFNLKF